jgi:hypothetical protein
MTAINKLFHSNVSILKEKECWTQYKTILITTGKAFNCSSSFVIINVGTEQRLLFMEAKVQSQDSPHKVSGRQRDTVQQFNFLLLSSLHHTPISSSIGPKV